MEVRIFLYSCFPLKQNRIQEQPHVNPDAKNIHIYNSKKSKTAVVPMTFNIFRFIQFKSYFLVSKRQFSVHSHHFPFTR